MRVFNDNNRLPLADVAKHADVTVVAGPIENITGGTVPLPVITSGSSALDAFEEAAAKYMREHPGAPVLNLLGT